jgi:hypothetical protein
MSGPDEPTSRRDGPTPGPAESAGNPADGLGLDGPRDGLAAVRGFRSSIGGLDQGTSDRIQTRISQHGSGRYPGWAPASGQVTLDEISRRRILHGDEITTPTSTVPRTRSTRRGPQPFPGLMELEPVAVVVTAPRPERRAAAAAALVVLMLASGLAVRSRLGGSEAGQSVRVATAPDASGLAALAAVARARPDGPLTVGQFEYTRVDRSDRAQTVRSGSGTGGTQAEVGLAHQRRERWAAVDGPGREVRGNRRLTPDDDPAAVPEDILGASDIPNPAGTGFGFDARLGYLAVRNLPADPAALKATIVARAREICGGSDCFVLLTLDLLAEPVATPAVRGALLDVLGAVGMTANGDGFDATNRPGRVFTIDQPDGHWRVVIDPGTAELLGWDQLGPADGALEQATVYLVHGVVPDMRTRP